MKPSCVGSTQLCRPTRTITGSGITGGSFPALIWQRFMLQALSGVPADAFPEPAFGFVTRVIDSRQGDCLAGRFTPDRYRVTATFAEGTAPKAECRLDRRGREVPDVFGFPTEEATDVLSEAGFGVEILHEYSSTYPPGRVIAQDPAGGERAPGGTTVVIVVSSSDRRDRGNSDGDGDGDDGDNDTTSVPDVLGMSEEDARARIIEAGFEVDVIHERESSRGQARKHRNEVWKQAPAGGTSQERGSTVTIWVNP